MSITSEATIQKAIHHYSTTGVILDILIPYYTQQGRWCGDRRNWRSSFSKKAALIMSKSILPSCRRIRICECESILLTSFHWRRKRLAIIPWAEVRGSIVIRSLESITARYLRSVSGDFYSRSISDVFLPRLTSVGGDMDLHETVKLYAPALAEVHGSLMVCDPNLPLLQSVGKRFWVPWSSNLHLPTLRFVGGDFDVAGSNSVIVPSLQWVGFSILLCYLTRIFSAPMLREVGGSLYASKAKVIHAAKLESVGDTLYTQSAIDYYKPVFARVFHWEMHPDAEYRWKMREAVRLANRLQVAFDV